MKTCDTCIYWDIEYHGDDKRGSCNHPNRHEPEWLVIPDWMSEALNYPKPFIATKRVQNAQRYTNMMFKKTLKNYQVRRT